MEDRDDNDNNNKHVSDQTNSYSDVSDIDAVPEADGESDDTLRSDRLRTGNKEDVAIGVDVSEIVHFKKVALLAPTPNFLFHVNALPVNDEPSNGGIAPRTDMHGR